MGIDTFPNIHKACTLRPAGAVLRLTQGGRGAWNPSLMSTILLSPQPRQVRILNKCNATLQARHC